MEEAEERYVSILLDRFKNYTRLYGERLAFKKILEFHDQEQALSWNTTCRGCANLLDQLYARDVEDGRIIVDEIDGWQDVVPAQDDQTRV